jgi:hypothetical protein
MSMATELGMTIKRVDIFVRARRRIAGNPGRRDAVFVRL